MRELPDWLIELLLLCACKFHSGAAAEEGPPFLPFCDNYDCSKSVQTLNTSFKSKFYRESSYGATAVRIPTNHLDDHEHEDHVDVKFYALKMVPNISDEAVVSHVWDNKGYPYDAFVADGDSSREDILRLLNDSEFSSGQIELPIPKLKDFLSSGCLDPQGYPVGKMAGRPTNCFSLLFNNNGTTEQYSGHLVLNAVHMSDKVIQYLGNEVDVEERSPENDLLCGEMYDNVTDANSTTAGSDYCTQLVYPGAFMRLCCCYTDFRLCHIHSNPWNRLAVGFRCLVGMFDSANFSQPDVILPNSERYAQTKDFYQRCYTFYRFSIEADAPVQLTVELGGANHAHSTTSNGHRIPDLWAKTNKSLYTYPTTLCPLPEEDNYNGNYSMISVCNFGDYCNFDKGSAELVSALRNYELRCFGASSLIAHILGNMDKCTIFVDQWTGLPMTYPTKNMLHIIDRTIQLKVHTDYRMSVQRREYRNLDPENCLNDRLPIRIVDMVVCQRRWGVPVPINCWELLRGRYQRPVCPHVPDGFVGVDNLAVVDQFFRHADTVPTNRTNRCIAEVTEYVLNGRKVLDLRAGALDNEPMHLIIHCLNYTHPCVRYPIQSPRNHTRWGVCCIPQHDPRLDLEAKIRAAVTPTNPKDINILLDSHKADRLCFAVPSPTAEDSNVIRCEDDYPIAAVPLADQKRLEYCRQMQNQPNCRIEFGKIVPSGNRPFELDFCCCSPKLENCNVDMSAWGRRVGTQWD